MNSKDICYFKNYSVIQKIFKTFKNVLNLRKTKNSKTIVYLKNIHEFVKCLSIQKVFTFLSYSKTIREFIKIHKFKKCSHIQ